MRLTLRTMLCYLDDVLEAADAEELRKKIEESEYASNVVHRIRTSMRRLRLGAPSVLGEEGKPSDANVVANYLDNTLPADQVPDFERVSLDLESEAHLAEVAACHQILTLVLGEPAEVAPGVREHMYRIGHADAGDGEAAKGETAKGEADAAVAAGEATNGDSQAIPAPPPVASPTATEPTAGTATPRREKPEVPEYLRTGSQRRWWPLALTLLLVALLIGGAVLAVWPTKPAGPVATVDGNGGDNGENLFDVDEDDTDTTTDTKPTDTTPADDAGAAADGTDEGGAGDETATDGAVDDGSGAEDSGSADDTSGDTAGGAADGSSGSETPATPEGGNDASAGEPGGASDTPDGSGTSDAASPPEPDGGDAVAGTPADGGASASSGTEDPELPWVDKVVGHYPAAGQVMVAFDKKLDAWRRLEPRATLKPGMRLRSLPTYRPQILLEEDLQVELGGESSVVVGNPREDGVAYLQMPYGRAIIATIGKPGNRIVVQAGERDVLMTLVNADAAVAVDVDRFHLPGTNPETERAHVRVTATVTSGQIQWEQAGAEPVTLDEGQMLTFLNEGIPNVATVEEMPPWIRSADIRDIDRTARATVEPLLDSDRAVEVILEELAQDRRVEVRSLAMRSLASLGQFDRIIETLDDETLKSYWSQHIDQLQDALAQGDDVAAKVRAAVVRQKGEDEAGLAYRLLWGFSPEQLADGSDKLLVDLLTHSSLDFRVLAINALRRITGRTHLYHPHLPEPRRRTAQRDWEQRLAAKEIVYATPPPKIPPRSPGAAPRAPSILE